MPSFVFRLIVIASISLAASTLLIAAGVAEGEIVRMTPYKVKESKGVFEFDVRADDQTKAVQEVTVSWVSAWAHEKGLRVGDRLLSIDGKPVIEMSFDRMSGLMRRQLKEGETQQLFFTGRRFLGRPIKLTWTSRG